MTVPLLTKATWTEIIRPTVRTLVTAAGNSLRFADLTRLLRSRHWPCQRGRQVAVETSVDVTVRPYPSLGATVRTIPLLKRTGSRPWGQHNPDPGALVFPIRNGMPQRRSSFRRQVWRPALVWVDLLGSVGTGGRRLVRYLG